MRKGGGLGRGFMIWVLMLRDIRRGSVGVDSWADGMAVWGIDRGAGCCE